MGGGFGILEILIIAGVVLGLIAVAIIVMLALKSK